MGEQFGERTGEASEDGPDGVMTGENVGERLTEASERSGEGADDWPEVVGVRTGDGATEAEVSVSACGDVPQSSPLVVLVVVVAAGAAGHASHA